MTQVRPFAAARRSHTEHREHTSYTHTLAVLDEWIPDPEARRCILAETPAALFRFSKETS